MGTIAENDSVIFFNYRPDRTRQITVTLVDRDFNEFDRQNGGNYPYFVCMTQYDEQITNVRVAFKSESLSNSFGEYISSLGYKQLRIAEMEKYAHVTFFFNGGNEVMYEGEDRALIPSPKVLTYDEKPQMSAYEVAEEAVRRIDSKQYDVVILNFANPDMVGHTGIFEAAQKAIEVIDECVGKVVDAVLRQDGIALITADHGNAEQMIDYETGDPLTAHTTNDVPLIGIGIGDVGLKEGNLSDLAPTMLELMGLPKPPEMTGESLIVTREV